MRLSPKNDPQKSPKRIVAAAHIVANHAAWRIMPGLRFLRSSHRPRPSRIRP